LNIINLYESKYFNSWTDDDKDPKIIYFIERGISMQFNKDWKKLLKDIKWMENKK
jgi:hypothetical protein